MMADAGPSASGDDALRDFFNEVKVEARVGEVTRVLACFRLNPYDILNAAYDDGPEAIRRAFRKASLLVHPDKCTHPRAKEAFELLTKANADLKDEAKRKDVDATIAHALHVLREERRKAVAKDNAYQAAAALKGGAAKLEADFEASSGFRAQWRAKSRELLLELEWRRRRLGKRLAEEEEREATDKQRFAESNKKKVAEHKDWQRGREQRASSWRGFVAGVQKKKKRKKAKAEAVVGAVPKAAQHHRAAV